MSRRKLSKPRVSSASRKFVALATATALTLSLSMSAFAAETPAVVTSSPASGGAAEPAADMPMSPAVEAQVEASISKEKAIALAKDYLSIPKTYTLQNASLSSSFDVSGIFSSWSLYFVYKVDGRQKGSINAQIDANTGELISYYSNLDNPNAKPVYPPKVSREQATEVAQSFLKKVAASYTNQIQLNAYIGVGEKPPLTGEVVHTIHYDRTVNGVPFVENYLELQVDGEGHILSYQRNWDKVISFEKGNSAFTSEEAAAKLKAGLKPELSYIIPYQMKQRKPLLVYNAQALAISAITGEPVGAGFEPTKLTQISDKPLGSKPSANGSLTKEQAAGKLKEAFGLPDGAKLSGSEYNEYQDELTGKTRTSWQLNYTVGDEKNSRTIWASVDGETGEIRSYSSYGSERTGSGIAFADAKKKAIEVLGKQLGWLADQYYLIEYADNQYEGLKPEEIGSYYFRAARKVHGAFTQNESAQVSINAWNGDVEYYYSESSGFDYPDKAPAVIGDEKAAAAWMDYYRVELTYQSDYSYYWNGQPIPIDKYKVMVAAGEAKPEELETKGVAKLVYRLVPRYAMDQSVTLDAATGKWLNTDDGTFTTLERPMATDIDGHWAQRELELMVAYKALDLQDGKVNPSAVVTRGEMIKMLVLAMNQGRPPIYYSAEEKATASFADVAKDSAYFAYVETAVEQQLIDVGDGTFNPEGKVDREELAELVVRALGYNPLAEHDNLFNINFADADKTKQKGQAAIAVGLGIMTLQNGKFLPERQVTRAEASVAFFRFLQAKADLKEAPLRDE